MHIINSLEAAGLVANRLTINHSYIAFFLERELDSSLWIKTIINNKKKAKKKQNQKNAKERTKKIKKF